MLVTKPGTYLATPESWGIKQEESKCPQFGIVFRCTQVRNGANFEDVEGDQRVTGFFTLVNKDGSPNEINLLAFHDALGWDGNNFSSLETSDWSGQQVQIVVESETYNNKTSLRVKYLNPKDYAGGGGIEKSDPQSLQSLDAKYGASLRAVFKKNGNASAKVQASPAVNVPVNPVQKAKDSAWRRFIEKTPGWETTERAETFKRIVGEIHLGVEPKDFDPARWITVERAISDDFSADIKGLIPV